MNYQKFDIENWNRKQHYEFFRKLEMPFFNITGKLNVTKALSYARGEKIPFSLLISYLILKEANRIQEYRLRMVDDELVVFDKVHMGTTIPTHDNTFLYATLPYQENLDNFVIQSKEEIERTIEKGILEPDARPDLIYFSAIPWISYTHISHAKSINPNDLIPRLAVGKYFEEQSKIIMPASIEVHHAVCDGYHVGLLFNQLEDVLRQF